MLPAPSPTPTDPTGPFLREPLEQRAGHGPNALSDLAARRATPAAAPGATTWHMCPARGGLASLIGTVNGDDYDVPAWGKGVVGDVRDGRALLRCARVCTLWCKGREVAFPARSCLCSRQSGEVVAMAVRLPPPAPTCHLLPVPTRSYVATRSYVVNRQTREPASAERGRSSG